MAEGSTSTTGEGGAPYEHPQWIKDEADAISKQGFVDIGNGVGAVRALVPEAESTHARIQKLMEEGIPEEEAKKRAVEEAVSEIEGKEKDYPDMAAYIRDQREKMDEYKVVLDGSVPQVVSRWFEKVGDYLRLNVFIHEGEGGTVGVAYLSKDNTIRFLCYPPGNCMIGGERTGGRFPTDDLARCGFNGVMGDQLTVRDWFNKRLEKEVSKRNSEKVQKRSQEFEF